MTTTKSKEQLAEEYILTSIDPSDYVDLDPDSLALKIFLAGYDAVQSAQSSRIEKLEAVAKAAEYAVSAYNENHQEKLMINALKDALEALRENKMTTTKSKEPLGDEHQMDDGNFRKQMDETYARIAAYEAKQWEIDETIGLVRANAQAIAALKTTVAELERERDGWKDAFNSELEGNKQIRVALGAMDNETMWGVIERVTKERDGLKNDQLQMQEIANELINTIDMYVTEREALLKQTEKLEKDVAFYKECAEQERDALSDLAQKHTDLTDELLESARLHGMGSSREAKLLAKIEELKKAGRMMVSYCDREDHSGDCKIYGCKELRAAIGDEPASRLA